MNEHEDRYYLLLRSGFFHCTSALAMNDDGYWCSGVLMRRRRRNSNTTTTKARRRSRLPMILCRDEEGRKRFLGREVCVLPGGVATTAPPLSVTKTKKDFVSSSVQFSFTLDSVLIGREFCCSIATAHSLRTTLTCGGVVSSVWILGRGGCSRNISLEPLKEVGRCCLPASTNVN